MTRPLPVVLLALVLAGALCAALSPGAALAAPPWPTAPAAGDLNRYVVAVLESFPTDGTHAYNWPRGEAAGSYAGVTEDLVYEGEVVAGGNAQRDAYCCGLTFEVMFKAWRAWAERRKAPFKIGDLDPAGLRKLRSDWYCATDDRTGPVKALVSRGLGVRVERLSDARPGDFVQLWRRNKSGHSVIFVGWERDAGGAITAIRYWSTQKATRGIGVRVERFAGDDGVIPDELYIARAGVPAKGR